MPLILKHLSFTFGEEIMGMKGTRSLCRSNNLHSDPLFLGFNFNTAHIKIPVVTNSFNFLKVSGWIPSSILSMYL